MSRAMNLTIYLLKSEITSFYDALQHEEDCTEIDLSPRFELDGKVFLKQKEPSEPSWLSFIREGIVSLPISLTVSSASAILFLQIRERILALTFGYGKHLLDGESYERLVGLKAVLNSVDNDKIRSISSQTLQELSISKRLEASRLSNFAVFGINPIQDMLTALTGIPQNTEEINRISGRDCLVVNTDSSFNKLYIICSFALDSFLSKDYIQKGFGFIDNIHAVEDPKLKNDLVNRLTSEINTKHLEHIYLSPPDIIDWEEVKEFRYSNQGTGESYPELRIYDYINTIPASSMISQFMLKAHKIIAVYDDDSLHQPWSIYRSLIAEIIIDDEVYLLMGGLWYSLSRNYVEQLNNEVDLIPLSRLDFPDHHYGESEDTYNPKAAKKLKAIMLHKELIKPSGSNTSFEFCDILTSTGDIVHIKKKCRSASLSHLFTQGIVSAQTLLADRASRRQIKDIINKLSPSMAAAFPTGNINPRDYNIIFGIIDDPKKNWPQSLPYISKIGLINACNILSSLQFNTQIVLIKSIH